MPLTSRRQYAEIQTKKNCVPFFLVLFCFFPVEMLSSDNGLAEPNPVILFNKQGSIAVTLDQASSRHHQVKKYALDA